MKGKVDFAKLFADAERSPAYAVERVVLGFTEDVVAQLEDSGINRAELARRIGSSPAYVTKILRGSTNFTLESMVRIAGALGCHLRTHLQPEGAQTRWFDLWEAPATARPAAFDDCEAMKAVLARYSKSGTGATETDHDPIPLAS